MNKQIKLLAEQARLITVNGQTRYALSEEFEQQFAELIVRECCEVAHCNFHVDGLTLGVMLKEHFGVEE